MIKVRCFNDVSGTISDLRKVKDIGNLWGLEDPEEAADLSKEVLTRLCAALGGEFERYQEKVEGERAHFDVARFFDCVVVEQREQSEAESRGAHHEQCPTCRSREELEDFYDSQGSNKDRASPEG